MSETVKLAVVAAARRILGPLARLLLEAGIGVGEFNVLAQRAFVAAAREMGDATHKTNVSRIALLTGLRRPQVTALLAADEAAPPAPDRGRHRAERVLAAWWTDSDFLDEEGRPRVLPLRGARHSFAALVKRYSGEPRVITLLDELVRVKAVRRLPDGRLEPLSRTYATARWDATGVETIGERIREHLETLLHNLKHPSRPRYERVIVNAQLDPRYAPLLLRDFTNQADTLADVMDDALNDPARTLQPSSAAQDALRLGIAIYVFEEPTVLEPGRSDDSRSRGRKRKGPRSPAAKT